MDWINFLHLYQPANSDAYRIKEAVDSSYDIIIKTLESKPEAKFTLNISGCLVNRLLELNYSGIIKRINKLIEGGQIELVGSAAYHALLPLVRSDEIVKQIKENEDIIKTNFPKAKLNGFFMPEMAYGKEAAKIIKEMGYKWIILDEISYSSDEPIDFGRVYRDKNSGLEVIFRSREFSSCYVPDKISEMLKNKTNLEFLITATDGELYGLRHKDSRKTLYKILDSENLKTLLVSDFISGSLVKNKIQDIHIRDSSWDSKEINLINKEPYHLWYSKKNKIHVKLWKFVDLAFKLHDKYKKDNNTYWSRWHLVRGLASCTFWWASSNDFSDIFGPKAWNPDEIERGAVELIRSIRLLESSTTKEEKIKAELFFLEIKKIIWTKHWSLYNSK